MRVGVDTSVSSVNHGSSSCKITFKWYTQNQYNYSDNNQHLDYSGVLSGSTTFDNHGGSGSVSLRDTKTYTYNYGSSEYGGSPGSVSATARLGYSYNGVHPSKTVSVQIPGRPYAPPAIPGPLTATRVSDNHIELSWSRNSTAGEPYGPQQIERADGRDGSYYSWKTVAYNATSWTVTNSLGSNRLIKFRLRATNSAGVSDWRYANWIWTTPAAPDQVSVSIGGEGNLNLSWRNNVSYDEYSIVIQRSDDGGAWHNVQTLGNGATSWRDNSPPSGTARYRVKAVSDTGSLSSAYGTSNTVSTAPDAPSGAHAALRSDGSIRVTWANNVQYDAYTVTVQRRTDGGAWANVRTGLPSGTTTWTDPTPPGGVNQYRVAAVGVNSQTSGWSTSNEVSTMVPPEAPSLLDPDGQTVDLNDALTLTWQYNPGTDGADQSTYQVQVSSDGGATWTAYDTGTVTSDTASATLPAGTLANGQTYQWRVRGMGVVDAGWGPYSAAATFTGATRPTVALNQPDDGGTVGITPLTATWEFAQAEAEPQAGYQVQLFQGGSTGGSALLEDSGEETGAATSYTFDTVVNDGSTYTVRVRAYSDPDLWSDWETATFTVDLLPPAPVDLEASYDTGTGTTQLTLTPEAAVPDETAPIQSVDIQRRIDGGEWVTILAGISLMDNPSRINIARNPSMNSLQQMDLSGTMGPTGDGTGGSATCSLDTAWADTGTTSLKITGGEFPSASVYAWPSSSNKATPDFVPGHTYTVSATIHLEAAQTGDLDQSARALAVGVGSPDGLNFNYAVSEQAPNEAGTTRLSVTFTVPADSYAFVRLMNGAAGDQPVWWDSVLCEEGSVVGAYFDGNTGATESTYYAWAGAADESESYQFSIDPQPVTVLDTAPITDGLNEYRAIVTSIAPSQGYSNIAVVDRDGVEDGQWLFLSYGDGFGIILRAACDPETSETVERSRSVEPMLGRRWPVLLEGENASRVVKVKATLAWGERCNEPNDASSPVDDFVAAELEAQVVLYRDYTGRRVFGSVGPLEITDGPLPRMASVSFDVTRIDYREGYLWPDGGGGG